MDDNNRNMILAIVLSGLVLIAWHFLYAGPKMQEEVERKKRLEQQKVEQVQPGAPGAAQPGAPGAAGVPAPAGQAGAPQTGAAPTATREARIAASPRVPIETPALKGSIALKGGRLDDLVLLRYRQTVQTSSPPVTLLSPSGSPDPFYVEHGWVPAGGTAAKLPDAETLWAVRSGGVLTPASPVTLAWDNGQGLIFTRTYTVDPEYMFSVRQEVENRSGQAVTLFPYALVSRHGIPKTEGFYIQHEGLIGVVGTEGLQEITYDGALKDQPKAFKLKTGGWLGITDKYWAAALIPPQQLEYQARFIGQKAATLPGSKPYFQADYMLPAVTVAAGAKAAADHHLFAGAKNVRQVEAYGKALGVQKLDLLVDWGWFYFITKPMFYLLDFFGRMLKNFGLAILATTVLVKLVFFPLANKSYESMSRMKKLQPEMERIRDRYKDDRAKQQQALMELYKKEKINPMAGCLPVLLQIPVFFALYKVLFTTIEMRHAPFFGWIKDLSAPDPTNLFNLFGLLPFTMPESVPLLHLGIWPLLMGVTMWVQMKLNPTPTDPVQEKVFAWMPVIFTFMLAPFAAGLVIYWTWNNILSILQQYAIMRKQGVEVPLAKNIGLDKLMARIGRKGSAGTDAVTPSVEEKAPRNKPAE